MSQKEKENKNAWIAPLIKTVISAPPIGPITPITCPICDCDHQVYQGSGIIAPSNKDGKLVCSFPTAETMAKIDLPGLELNGVTHYTRYHCACGGHDWAVITAFHEDKTVVWCSQYQDQPSACQCKSTKLPSPELADPGAVLPVAVAEAQPGKNPVQDALAQMGFNTGHPPLIVISPALLQEMYPAAYDQLKQQLANISNVPAPIPSEKITTKGPPSMPPKVPTMKPKKAPVHKIEVTEPVKMSMSQDHEHPLALLPPKMNLRFQSWLVEDRIDADGILPPLPPKLKAKNKPPHRVAGAVDSKTLKLITEWLFMLSVELKDVTQDVHGFVYWHTSLLVLVDDDHKNDALFKIVVDGIASLGALKPTNVIIISRTNYEELRKFKEAKDNEDKS